MYCDGCNDGYFLHKQSCCPNNCAVCEKSDCLACKNHFVYTNKVCQAGSCSDPNCAQCGSQGCYACYQGYILVDKQCKKGKCSSIYPNCFTCDVTGCTECDQGYLKKDDGTCYDPKYVPWYGYVGGAITFIITLTLLCYCICCWKGNGSPYTSSYSRRKRLLDLDTGDVYERVNL